MSFISLLVSCSDHPSVSFDEDYGSLLANVEEKKIPEKILYPTDNEGFLFLLESISLPMHCYYQKLKDKFTYVFVLTFDGMEKEIKDIRSFVALENEDQFSIAQIGFDGKRKNIAAESKNDFYKGLQFFVTPFLPEKTKVHFYFECENFSGDYYTFSMIKEG